MGVEGPEAIDLHPAGAETS